MTNGDVFISYRRDGGDMVAMNLYQALKKRRYRVFYDIAVLRSGNFNEELYQRIRSCKDFILILTPGSLDRCIYDEDWVRMEIAEAIHRKKNIIPFMLNNFEFPDYLPEDIDAIRYMNGIRTQPEIFNESIRRLCTRFLISKPAPGRKKPNIGLLICLLICLLSLVGLIVYFLTSSDHL
ncbi:MAG: toll/interleukin-1 receptor domain-containing protein [Clostridia bacterium]|nr:toll/interleukin-1 receptor domain-containing protein [Clostridia bacterium]